ncbi:MAG TPA: hypothetical protein DEQ74_02950 [Wolbachia sp.]|nr:hypothetical protein [Wolbachia sp.]
MKYKSKVNKKTRKYENKVTLFATCLYLMAAVSLILHIGILIGLASSIGALVGFALSFMSLTPIIGGVISSISMLSAFYIIKKIGSNCLNHYIDLVMAPSVNNNIKRNLTTLGCSSLVITSIGICVYFGIGAGLVALDIKSPAAIGALTVAIISAMYVSWMCIDKVIEYFSPRKAEQPNSCMDSDVTLESEIGVDANLQSN